MRGTDSSIHSQAWRSQFPLLFKARQSSLQPALTLGSSLSKCANLSPLTVHLGRDTAAVECSGPYQSQI